MQKKNPFADIAAGLVTSSVSLAYCFSFGALIFAGPLQPYLGQGVAAALICSGVIGLVISLRGGFSVSVSGPEGNTAALIAAMMIALAPILAAQPGDGALYLALAALAATGVATGVALYLLGHYRRGRLARFIPYPVLAGFQAASGWIMATGAIRMSTGFPVHLATLSAFATGQTAAMLAVTAVWAGVLWMLTARIKHVLTLPVALIAAAAAADLAFSTLPSLSAVQADWMFPATKGMQLSFPILAPGFWHAHWTLLPHVTGEIAAVVMMAALTIALTETSIEEAWRSDVDLDRELRVHGIANIASGLLGGMVGHIVFNRTLMAREAGASGRVAGLIVALVGLAALGGGLQFIVYIPRFVLGGLLLQLGARLVWRWCVTGRHRLAFMEWLLVPAILAVTAWFGVLIGFLTGILGGCVIFVVSVSRVDIVKHQFAVDERPSSLVRSVEEMALIAEHGHEIQVVQLATFIFFGQAYRLQERVRTLISVKTPKMMIFDFSLVSGIDSSAGSSLLRIEEMLRHRGIAHVTVGTSTEILHVMGDAGGLGKDVIRYDSLDKALECGEEAVLGAHGGHATGQRPLIDWLTEALGDAHLATRLIAVLEPAAPVEAGYLCRAGDPTDTLLFIEHGRVSVEVEHIGHSAIRQRVFGANTIVGEVGFFLDVPRTADLRIDGAAAVWALSHAAYDRLSRDAPDITAALLTYIVRIQAERLAFSSRQVAALQR
jgi:SulP family sulfate permease